MAIELTRKIVKVLDNDKTLTRLEIAKAVDATDDLVALHLHGMINVGIVYNVGEKRGSAYHLTPFGQEYCEKIMQEKGV